MTEVSSTRLYLGNLPRNGEFHNTQSFSATVIAPHIRSSLIRYIATKADVESHFSTHGTGEITEIKLMNGFGFIEYKDAMDARDVVPGEILAIRARIMAYQTHSLPRFRFYGRASNSPICTWHSQS
jgi:RNA recognition motif. (a.k.a. RRM, RBD, or RNP domain)